ncbi:MAG: hypothetical protein E6H63_16220 [Betaproteobacteria bacterium]|nr:MAG: hypothetical protein E6H63_16220 [Betaproteobacteria bacterium]
MRGNCYDVTGSIRTTDAGAVGTEVARLYRKLFASADPQPLERAFADAVRLYDGGDPAYLPCETEYHDIQHVLDVTLAMARLMDGYQSSSSVSDEALSPELYTVGILAALFHDFGYLRKRNDHRHRYGAEYTLTHVSRGAAFLRGYVRELGFSDTLAQLGGTLLHFTGYERRPEAIRIGAGLARRVGELLGTADIIAQMSDRCYLEKCRDRLYPEFVLGALGAPRRAARFPAFASGADLVAKTPTFYEHAVHRLNAQLGRAYDCAARHFGGANLYIDAMRRNAAYAAEGAAVLRRKPPHTLLPEVQPYPRDLFGLAH